MIAEVEPRCECPLDEAILVGGEQTNKLKLLNTMNLFSWKDLRDHPQALRFARFVSPGRYTSAEWQAHRNILNRASFDRAFVRRVRGIGSKEMTHELELVFRASDRDGSLHRLLISGIDVQSLPQLRAKDYHRGWQMPLGISVPPTEQTYERRKSSPLTSLPTSVSC